MEEKALSCGVIITDGEYILGCVPYGNKDKLDLPKGHLEENEDPKETAVREVEEETGLKINIDALEDAGMFRYTRFKDLHLYILFVDEMPDTDRLICTSMFEHPYQKGVEVPEVVGYKITSNIQDFYKSLQPILTKIFKDL